MCQYQSSQATPSPSPSKLCGSGGNALKFIWVKSAQSRSGGGLLIQKSGYAGSQLLELPVPDLIFAAGDNGYLSKVAATWLNFK